MIEKSHRWHKTAIAAAAAALLTLNATDASALSLGRIAVQSALGETLRAEIDIPEINAEEAATLHAGVVPAAAFAAAGLEYNAVMASLQATLMRRPDGRAYLRLTTDRAVNDPFVDLILEASWSSGRIVRDYTLLLDPPQVKAQVAPTLPQTNAAGMSPSKPQTATPPASPPAPAPATSESGRNTASAPKSAPPNAANRVSAAPATTEKASASPSGNQLVVKAGDTASKLAQANKASDVSLDQMLVAMMRNNPDAFSKGNLNRLRAGAVLDLPSAEQAKTISTAEASQIVVAQSKDFNEFRRTLAENAPKTESETPNRKASGNVEARVDERKSANATPDKLTLSKGALAAAKSAEAALAKDRAKQDAADRAAELERNIADLNKLKSATESTATSATGSANAPAVAAGAAPAMAASEDKPMAAVAPMPAPVASAPMVPPAPVPEPSLVDQFLQDPVIPLAGAGGVLALIAGLWAARRRAGKKKELNHVDSSFLESRLTADSFFGASGGQQVDTAGDSASSTGAPPVYAASQSDPADDVDPVAEADVYLAYGRDLQAEEILKEALRSNPSRIAIHQKILEIFAKRRDAVSFQQSATLVQKLTGGVGEDWQRVCAMGLGIDPENPLYQGAREAVAPTARTSAFGGLETTPAAAPGPDTVASSGLDLDLDIDFPDGDAAPSIIKTVTSQPAPLAAAPEAAAPESNALDFDLSMPAELSAKPAAPEAKFVHEPFVEAPELALHEPAAEPEVHPAHQAATELQHLETQAHHPETQAHELEEDATPAANAGPESLLHFDMSGLSLDLDSPTQAGDLSQPAGQHSLETKLALAEEFVSIGDHDGARALIEEVIADASGPIRERAEQALAALR